VNDRDALLTAILNDPADDLARLVLADLLRESDDLDDRARGRFLWAGVTASQYRSTELIEDRLYYTAQDEFTEIASAGYPARWLAALGLGSSELDPRDWGWDSKHDRITVRLAMVTAVFTRGLLSGLTVPTSLWSVVAERVFASCPLEQLAYLKIPGLSFAIEKATAGWQVTGRFCLPRGRVSPAAGVVLAAVAPAPPPARGRQEWKAQTLVADRSGLLDAITSVSFRLAAELREVVGELWPGR